MRKPKLREAYDLLKITQLVLLNHDTEHQAVEIAGSGDTKVIKTKRNYNT